MKLLCDENVGTRVPRALKLVGLKTISLADKYGIGKQDVEWLKDAGARGWLVFSYDRNMIDVSWERETIIAEKVGIVFLTSGDEHPHKVLLLLLKKWDWLEQIDQTTLRPFAYYLSPYGRIRQISLC